MDKIYPDADLGTVSYVSAGTPYLAEAKCKVDADMYQVCRVRGHDAKYALGPWSVCRWCGVHFKWELIEDFAPTKRPQETNAVDPIGESDNGTTPRD